MRKPATTRLAGTLSAIPIFAILAAVATSPAARAQQTSPVLNNQINLGEIFSEQALNVQTASDGVTASTTAQANGVSIGVTNADASVTSTQENQGKVYAHGVVDVGADAGAAAAARTTAVGNSGAISASNGTVSARVVQLNSNEVTARGQVEAADASAKDLTVSTLAMGNSQGVNLNNGSAGTRISQSTTANVLADGGAIVGYVSGTSAVTATTAGNNINVSGGEQSAVRAITDQANTADVTQASVLVQLAEQAGIPRIEFAEAFDSQAMQEATAADFTWVQDLGIAGFPTLLAERDGQLALLTNGYQPLEVLAPLLGRWLERAAHA